MYFVIVLVSFTNTNPPSGTVIVTSQVSTSLPSDVVTVIVVFPGPTPVTFPNASTIATESSLVHQTIFWLVALTGDIVADSDLYW